MSLTEETAHYLTRREQILTLLADGNTYPAREIHRRLPNCRVSHMTVTRDCNELVSLGRLTKTTKGYGLKAIPKDAWNLMADLTHLLRGKGNPATKSDMTASYLYYVLHKNEPHKFIDVVNKTLKEMNFWDTVASFQLLRDSPTAFLQLIRFTFAEAEKEAPGYTDQQISRVVELFERE